MKIHCIYGCNSDSNIYIILGENSTIIDCGTGLHNEEVARYIKKIVDALEINSFDFTEMKWWVEKKAALDKEARKFF